MVCLFLLSLRGKLLLRQNRWFPCFCSQPRSPGDLLSALPRDAHPSHAGGSWGFAPVKTPACGGFEQKNMGLDGRFEPAKGLARIQEFAVTLRFQAFGILWGRLFDPSKRLLRTGGMFQAVISGYLKQFLALSCWRAVNLLFFVDGSCWRFCWFWGAGMKSSRKGWNLFLCLLFYSKCFTASGICSSVAWHPFYFFGAPVFVRTSCLDLRAKRSAGSKPAQKAGKKCLRKGKFNSKIDSKCFKSP